jgi:hypothetical protein
MPEARGTRMMVATLRAFASRKNSGRGALAEEVVDDLDRGAAGIFDGLQRLFDLFDRHAPSGDLALGFQGFEAVEQGGGVVDFGRRAVELDEVEAVDAKIGQAAVDEGFDVFDGVAGGDVGREAAAGLGGDEGAHRRAISAHRG